jgi:hypothetical protein
MCPNLQNVFHGVKAVSRGGSGNKRQLIPLVIFIFKSPRFFRIRHVLWQIIAKVTTVAHMAQALKFTAR